ncbi:uncharacterized protein O3C94_008814 isoform 2-T2 [Discoglossus pictus]
MGQPASQADVGHVISVTDHEKELTRLREEIQELREELEKSNELIANQQQLLQEQMLPQPGEALPSPLWDAYFLEEQLRLQQDKESFEAQRLAFQEERNKFTEAAIRLGRERLQFKSDQALFIKQQFLNMTPGLSTPPWKKTPPWSALTPDSSARSLIHPKVSLTPHLYGVSTSLGRRETTSDPMTPTTAELYRVLRLAPPSRSVLASQTMERSVREEETKSEDMQRWRDSFSPSNEPTYSEGLPPSTLPIKLSMTPYLRPRPTPMSVPRDRGDPVTPSTANLFKKQRLSIVRSASPGKKEHGKTEKMQFLNQLHNLEQTCPLKPSVCCSEKAGKCSCESTSQRARASCDEDSLNSGDHRKPFDDQDHTSSEGCTDNSGILERDSLCGTGSFHERDILHSEGESPSADDRYHSKRSEATYMYLTDRRKSIQLGLSGEASTLLATDRKRSLSGEAFHPIDSHKSLLRETRHETCSRRHSEAFHNTDLWKCKSRDALYASESRRRSVEAFYQTDSCRRRLKESSENKRKKSEDHYMTDSCRSLLRDALHATESHRRLSREALHSVECQKSRRESLHHDECHLIRERSSLRRRLSSHHRDSLYTSGPGRSPLHFRQSCPSWTPCVSSYVCADLLSQFLDCSS